MLGIEFLVLIVCIVFFALISGCVVLYLAMKSRYMSTWLIKRQKEIFLEKGDVDALDELEKQEKETSLRACFDAGLVGTILFSMLVVVFGLIYTEYYL